MLKGKIGGTGGRGGGQIGRHVAQNAYVEARKARVGALKLNMEATTKLNYTPP